MDPQHWFTDTQQRRRNTPTFFILKGTNITAAKRKYFHRVLTPPPLGAAKTGKNHLK
jgi:hypothetical protein